MKKTYTRPEIAVSKFDVENVITASAVDLTASIYTQGTGAGETNVVKVVSFTEIFGQKY